MPTFEDRTLLPYVEALFREILRWRPVLPLGVSHAASEEDIYKGYYIPKSNLVHLRIFGQHIIVVNTYEDAIELFEKRSNIYSDRPHLEMIYLMGWDFNSALKHYGDDWRQHRRLFQQLFKREVSIEYQPIQTRKVNDMLYGLLTTPEDFIAHAKTVTAAIIVSTMYGHDITPKNDYFVTLAETALAKLREAVFPGALAVNAFPILKYLPTWFPGAGFKRFALGVQDLVNQMLTVPIEALEKRLADGTAQPCVSSSILEDCKSKEEYEVIEAVAATAYAGGSDTTVSVIETFFLAMTMFPEAQKKAQDEIDKVVGNGRMPTYDDRESLPLIEAFVRELLRWRPVTPLGVWHASTEEDIYNGYYLPKGATFFPNVWAMAHNPQKYDRPEDFNPDRFFGNDSKLNDDEVPYAFGFGRRLCPGRYMASATLPNQIWLSVATVLALFNIQRTKDADGNEVCPEGKYCDELAL
ncbi:unnamed protein product [Cyclocybe aegerita]|uniref:Cytochrome P450 n=1 Tax=Cyclocybe aegerita TaxID=1973307 RepID=A0A8S0W3X0_CYCAE|nr:unnamed protein product [Cyclocybe aegerita]